VKAAHTDVYLTTVTRLNYGLDNGSTGTTLLSHHLYLITTTTAMRAYCNDLTNFRSITPTSVPLSTVWVFHVCFNSFRNYIEYM